DRGTIVSCVDGRAERKAQTDPTTQPAEVWAVGKVAENKRATSETTDVCQAGFSAYPPFSLASPPVPPTPAARPSRAASETPAGSVPERYRGVSRRNPAAGESQPAQRSRRDAPRHARRRGPAG